EGAVSVTASPLDVGQQEDVEVVGVFVDELRRDFIRLAETALVVVDLRLAVQGLRIARVLLKQLIELLQRVWEAPLSQVEPGEQQPRLTVFRLGRKQRGNRVARGRVVFQREFETRRLQLVAAVRGLIGQQSLVSLQRLFEATGPRVQARQAFERFGVVRRSFQNLLIEAERGAVLAIPV